MRSRIKPHNALLITIIVYYVSGCAVYKNPSVTSNDTMFFYFGSGYDHEIVKVYFNNYEFQFEATSDFSTGVVLSHYFKCSNSMIMMFRNNSIIDSVKTNTCNTLNFRVQTAESEIEKYIISSKGQYVIVDMGKATDELNIVQSKKPFSLE